MGTRKQYIGIVVSDKMQKTRVVKVTRVSKHAKYGRMIRSYNKFKIHDENNISKMDDQVRIEETRPLSKDKRYRLIEVIKKSETPRIEIKE
ncbi:MAG: 30S ribosomal protein S17 [Candidatus Omnitrophica bacterium]|nr:30S ribosomal protein S17 [Candidatus Omnitrophota bacterium]